MSPPNVHHLELFYYVATFGGITPAVRNMPYGIQQPAVSSQMLQLERELGVKLFNRRPFALTPAGRELQDFISSFFSGLPHIAAQLRGEESVHLRLAASGTVLANHIPDVLEKIRCRQPNLRLTLQEAVKSSDIELLLANQEIDFAISTLQKSMPAAIKTIELLRLPLMLIAPESSTVKRFSAIAKDCEGKISKPLISLSSEHEINRIFHDELIKRKLVWTPKVEVTSLELVTRYTSCGYGYGLTIDAPGVKIPASLRRIALPRFPPLRLGLMFQGKLKPVAELFALEAVTYAKKLKI
jgi:DNA-binding transcriptional LysR family regulator